MTAPRADNPIIKAVAPVLDAAGFSRKGNTWRKDVGDVVQRVSIGREMKYRDCWSIMLHIDVKETTPSSRNGIVHEVLVNQIYNIDRVDRTSWRRIRDALNLRAPILDNERASILANAVRDYALPTLDRVGSRQGLVACYLGEALREEISLLGRLDWRVAKLVGLRWMNTSVDVVDVAVLGKHGARLTGNELRGRGGALLHLWNGESRACVKQNEMLAGIVRKGLTKNVYGIHTDNDTEKALEFFRRHGNPYTICGIDDREIWDTQRVPQTFVVDRKGRVIAHFGALKEADLEKHLPAVITVARSSVRRR